MAAATKKKSSTSKKASKDKVTTSKKSSKKKLSAAELEMQAYASNSDEATTMVSATTERPAAQYPANQQQADQQQVAAPAHDKAATGSTSPRYVLVPCKREGYIRAWETMYDLDKKIWMQPMFDGINPALNKRPLSTEVDNFCVMACDANEPYPGYPAGKPVGIFSMVVTKRGEAVKVIGKQYVVHPDHQRKGIGTAMMVELMQELMDNGYGWFYIGCSKMSASILKGMGFVPYASDEVGDLYKFNVDLNAEQLEALRQQWIGKSVALQQAETEK